MGVVDFIFFNLYAYYNSGIYKLKWTTPEGWTIYVMIIGLLLWEMVVGFTFNQFILHTPENNIEKIIGLTILILMYYLLYIRYVKSENHLKIFYKYRDNGYGKRINKPGLYISIAFVVAIPMLLILLLIIIHNN